jgi:hypothetical protein
MRGTYHSEKTEQHLQAAASQLRLANPALTFVVDSGAVWLRHGGRDWGLYSATIGDDRIVYVYDDATRTTVLHRDSPGGAA